MLISWTSEGEGEQGWGEGEGGVGERLTKLFHLFDGSVYLKTLSQWKLDAESAE